MKNCRVMSRQSRYRIVLVKWICASAAKGLWVLLTAPLLAPVITLMVLGGKPGEDCAIKLCEFVWGKGMLE